jgi:hypothetical protein
MVKTTNQVQLHRLVFLGVNNNVASFPKTWIIGPSDKNKWLGDGIVSWQMMVSKARFEQCSEPQNPTIFSGFVVVDCRVLYRMCWELSPSKNRDEMGQKSIHHYN